MSNNTKPILKVIVKWQLIVLLLTIILKYVNLHYLDTIIFFILDYPGNEVNDLLWWQKYDWMEKLGWYLIDYIDNKHSN